MLILETILLFGIESQFC